MNKSRVDSAEVAAVFLFSALDDTMLTSIAAASSKRRLTHGDVLFNFGDPVNHFYYVVKGQVQLSRSSSSGDEKVIALIGAGETFAEALMFGQAARGYPVDARMVQDGELLAFEVSAMRSLLAESTDACFKIMASMSRRLHELIVQIDDITLHDATYRLVSFLLTQLPSGAEHARDIQLVIPKLVIASRLSIQPETFSRILARLRHDGLLDGEGAHIVLKDVERLRQIVEG